MPEPAPDPNKTFTGVYLIGIGCFSKLIQRDGFGAIIWTESCGEAFVSIQVMDKGLITELIQAGETPIDLLLNLDTVIGGNSA